MTDGMKTSEFWGGLVTLNVMYFNDVMGWGLTEGTVMAMAMLMASYVLGRSAVKAWLG